MKCPTFLQITWTWKLENMKQSSSNSLSRCYLQSWYTKDADRNLLCVCWEKKLQEMFFNSRGLVEAEELRKLKVKRTVSLAFCQDCQQPRVLLFMMPRPLPHTDSTVIHLIASDSFKWTWIHLNFPFAGCLVENFSGWSDNLTQPFQTKARNKRLLRFVKSSLTFTL